MNITAYEPGAFSWAEVATPDADASRAFYTRLFGLAATDMQTDEGDLYTILKKDGKDVCGLYGMSKEDMERMSGGRAVWRAYFTVDDADRALTRVRDLGGTVIHEPVVIGKDGRLAAAQDPTGAAFVMWEPRDHYGAQVAREPGALTWAELYTRDTQAASSFYSGLFGWASHTVPSPDGGDYTLFQLDGAEARRNARHTARVGADAGPLGRLLRGRRPGRLTRQGERPRRRRAHAAHAGRRRRPVRLSAGPARRGACRYPARAAGGIAPSMRAAPGAGIPAAVAAAYRGLRAACTETKGRAGCDTSHG